MHVQRTLTLHEIFRADEPVPAGITPPVREQNLTPTWPDVGGDIRSGFVLAFQWWRANNPTTAGP